MPATPTMIATSGADQSGSIDRLYVRQNWTNGMPTGRLGLVSVSTTWAGLPFMELSADTFEKTTFKISANQANSGILSINSIFNLENVKLSIYDVSGKIVETKNITLSESNNSIAINPINNSGIYIVEMVVSDKKYTQKISVN